MKNPAISIVCPSAAAAAFVTAYLDSEGHAALWAVFDDAKHTVLTLAPLALVTQACDAADSALRLSAQRGSN